VTQKQIIRKIEALKVRQEKLRDEMREFIAELEMHEEAASEAVRELETAADTMSRYV
jgi:hypothetical protein